MLVICNGAPKSGTNWLAKLQLRLMPLAPVPERFQDPGWTGSSLAAETALKFFRRRRWERKDYFCKQHWHRRAFDRKIARHPEVRVANILRDVRDVTVSRYYFDRKLGLIPETMTFAERFADGGVGRARGYARFQAYWHGRAGAPFEPVLLSYEGLHTNFDAEVTRLAASLGLDLDAAKLAQLRAESSFDSMRTHWVARKGVSGDWAAHFTPEMARAMQDRLERFGYFELVRALIDRFEVTVAPGFLDVDWAEAAEAR